MNETREHWLRRPETIRKLWIWGSVLLAALVVLGLFIEGHPHFALEKIPGFNAWYGFGTCVAMVVGAKILGFVLKREDTYYDRD